MDALPTTWVLGKTVQTLTLLQAEKEAGAGTTLLIMPTSLIYNWEMEASKFAPCVENLELYGNTQE